MAGGTEFLIQIEQQLKGDNPVSALQKTEQALKAAQDEYKQLEATVNSAGKALERAGANVASISAKLEKAKAGGDATGIQKLSAQLTAAKAKEAELATAAEKAAQALKKQSTSVTELASETLKLKKADEAEKDAEKNRERSLEATAKTGDAFNKLGGPLGALGTKAKDLTEGWRDLTKSVGTGPAIFAVAAIAIVAVVAALVAGAYAAAKFALGQADAARSANLTQEAFLKQIGAGSELTDTMKAVEASTGIASDRQRDIIKSLRAANVAADQIPDALRAIAKQEAALGDSSGTQELIDNLKAGKKSARELASEMESKFGDVVRKKMIGLDAQQATFGKNLSGLFSGIKIEPFLEGLSKIVGLFDSSTVSGSALKTLMTAMFQPLSDAAGNVMPKIERFILGFELGALKVGIAVKKMAGEFGFKLGASEKWPDVAEAGAAAAFVLAGAVLGAALGFLLIGAVIAAPIALLYMLVDTVVSVAEGFDKMEKRAGAAIDDIVSKLTGQNWNGLGLDIIKGIVAGMTGGASLATGAAANLGKSIVAAFRSKDGIDAHSPARKFIEAGLDSTEGYAIGVDRGAPDAQDSITAMVQPRSAKLDASGGGSARGAVTIGTIIINGVTGAAEMIDELASHLEERMLQSGSAAVTDEAVPA